MNVGKYIKLPALLLAVILMVFGPIATILVAPQGSVGKTVAPQALAAAPTAAAIQSAAEKFCVAPIADPASCRVGFRAGATNDTKPQQCGGLNTLVPNNPSCLDGFDAGKLFLSVETAKPSSDKSCPTTGDLRTCFGEPVLTSSAQDQAAKDACTSLSTSGSAPSRHAVCVLSFLAGVDGGASKTDACGGETGTKKSDCETAYDKGATYATAHSGGSSADECDGGSFGFIICPILSSIEAAVKGIEESLIIPFLEVTPLTTSSPSYRVWDVLRNLANVIFVIVFFVIIFGNLFSVSAYTIKKMLPRLIAAAILVQISFFLVSIAVDITNVFGSGLYALVSQAIPGSGYAGQPGTAGAFVVGAAFTGLVAAASVAAISGTLAITAIGAFLSILGVFFTLMFRQIAIIMLIVTAPIAMAAWVLPGTDKFFKKWYEALIKILIMYPLIVLLFAASKLFGASVTDANIGGAFKPVVVLIGTVAPLFMVPLTFKVGGSLLKLGANVITGRTGSASKSLKTSDMAKNMRADAKVKNADRIGAVMGSNAGQRVLGSKAGGKLFGSAATQARIARTQTGNFNEQKKRLTDAGASVSDLQNFLNEDYKKISPQGSYLEGMKKSASAQAAAASILAENGLWGQKQLGKLNGNSSLSDAEKDRIHNYVLSGKGFGETFKKNRVLAMAPREAIKADGSLDKTAFNKNEVTQKKLASIRGASGALSGNELANFNSDGMELLGEMGADGIGQVNPAAIKNLTDNQRLYSSMTDSQREGIYNAVAKNQAATITEFRNKHATLSAELRALAPGTADFIKKQRELAATTNKLTAFEGTPNAPLGSGGVVQETTARIDSHGVAIAGKAI